MSLEIMSFCYLNFSFFLLVSFREKDNEGLKNIRSFDVVFVKFSWKDRLGNYLCRCYIFVGFWFWVVLRIIELEGLLWVFYKVGFCDIFYWSNY